MQPEQPIIPDHAKLQPASSIGSVIGGFLGGWFLGIIVTGILADLITRAMRGHSHDGGMYFVAGYAIFIEAPALAILRAALGPSRVNGKFAFTFGLACGPILLAALLVIGLLVVRR